MNFEKYNPLAKKNDRQGDTIPDPPPLNSWRDSKPIVDLSDFLKMHQDQGIKLCQRDRDVVLMFEPGLTTHDKQTGRWAICNDAVELMMLASDDLHDLISRGLLELPTAASLSTGNEKKSVNHLEQVALAGQTIQIGLDLSGKEIAS